MKDDNLTVLDSKPKVGPLAERVILLALQFATTFINKIKDDYARETLQDMNGAFQGIIRALADADENDKAQIKGIIDGFLSDTGFVDRTKDELIKKIQALQDERLQEILITLLPVSFDIIKILFDAEPANEEQIKARLKAVLSGDEGVTLIENILRFVIKDEALAATMALLIANLINSILVVEAAEQ